MKKLLTKILREPLLHFLCIGAALYTVHAIATASDARLIVLSEREINNYLNTYNRNGTHLDEGDSLQLTRRLITRKVLLAEALSRDFHLYDPGVAERLVDRMQLALIKDTIPDEQQVLRYFHQNEDKYQPSKGASTGFEAVKSQVMNDLMMRLREESYQRNLRDLMEQYTVQIDKR